MLTIQFLPKSARVVPLVDLRLRGFLARSQCALGEFVIRHPTRRQDANEFYAYPGIAKLKVLDVLQAKSSEITMNFFKEMGKEQLACASRGCTMGLQGFWNRASSGNISDIDGRINLGRTNMLNTYTSVIDKLQK